MPRSSLIVVVAVARASASYITGPLSLKVGYTGGFIMLRQRSYTAGRV